MNFHIKQYLKHGWSLVPLPPGSKGPTHAGWNLKENALKTDSVPPGFGVGLAHAYSGTMALDIDDMDRAAAELLKEDIDIYTLMDHVSSVRIESGSKGHGKLLFAMPDGLVLPSRKLTDVRPDGSIYNYLDFRCGTANGLTVQDVLPPSIHPDTRQPYRWEGRGHWLSLPVIPNKLLKFWQSLIDKDSERVIANNTAINSSWNEIIEALGHISPNCSRKEWIDIGMALHWTGSQHGQSLEQAYSVWNEWSKKSVLKYPGEKVVMVQWRSFAVDKNVSITLGTLLHTAKENGWRRMEADVSHLFKQVAPPIAPINIRYDFEVTPPAVNLSLLPTVLATRAKQMSVAVGCDPLVPLWAGLAAACACADARSRLELMEGFKVPPILWLMTVGAPADKKTPGSTPMMQILYDLEKEDLPRFKKEFLQWEAKEAQWSSQHKAFLDYNRSPEALIENNSPPELAELPPQPRPLRIVVEDITSQKLVRNAAEQPRGLLCYLDEMNSWVRKMNEKNSGEDRSAWAKSYESRYYVMDRVGAGTIQCENLAVAMYGNIQPRVLRENVKALAADGLLHRFLPCVLTDRYTTRPEIVPSFLNNTGQWNSVLRTIYSLPQMEYKLNQDAYRTFREFQTWYEVTRKDERLLCSSDNFMMAFGKLEGLVGRVAMIFHMIENPYSPLVSNDVMTRTIEFVKSYIIPTLRYTLGELEDSSAFDTWLKNYILTTDEATLTAADIKVAGKTFLNDIPTPWGKHDVVTRGMYILEVNQWVIRLDDKSKDHQGLAAWAIRPELKVQFKADRDKVAEAMKRRVKRENLNDK